MTSHDKTRAVFGLLGVLILAVICYQHDIEYRDNNLKIGKEYSLYLGKIINELTRQRDSGEWCK